MTTSNKPEAPPQLKTAPTNDEDDSCLRKISTVFQRSMHSFFFRLGFFIGNNPWKTIAFTFVVTGLCSIGLVSYRVETRDTELFTPKGTLAFEHLGFIQDNFPGTGYIRQERMIMTSKDTGGDIATKSGLLSLVNILKVSESTTVEFEGRQVTHSDLCFRSSDETGVSHCYTPSVLDLFYDKDFITGSPPNFLDTVEKKIETLTDSGVKATLSLSTYKSWNGGALLPSKIIGNSSGVADSFKAEAFYVEILLDSTPVETGGKIEDARAIAWEREWIKNFVDVTVEGAEGMNIYINAVISEEDESLKTEGADFSKIVIGYSMVGTYVCLMLGHFNPRFSRNTLGCLGLLSVGLGFLATNGIGSALGFPKTQVHDALLLLLFAIGIDDAFVIMSAYDHTDRSLPIPERMAWALSDAGFAISTTSFTNASAFFIGALTGLPALQSFCVWAGIGIMFIYLFQSTFFIACATLDERRRARGNMDVLFCLKTNTDGELNLFGQKHGAIERFFENKYVPFLFNNKVRFPLLIFALGLFSTCAYGMSQLRQDFWISFFYSGYVKRFDEIEKQYFNEVGDRIGVFTGKFEYETIENQKLMAQLFDPDGDLATNKWVVDGTLESWYTEFRAFASLDTVESTLEPSTFYTELQAFLSSPAGARFAGDINLNNSTGTPEITATRSYFVSIFLESNDIQVDCMQEVRATIDSVGLPEAFPFTFLFIFYEQFAVLVKEALQVVFFSLAVVFLVTLLLIANPLVSIIVLVGVGFSLVDILGVLHFWDINLNSVSVIVLSMAVGLTIDSAAHMGLGFMESVGTKRERVALALKHLGPPLVHGSVSTFIAISVLMFSVSYIFQTFFKMFLLIIVFGGFHGIVIVPILLDLLGPAGYYKSQEEKERTEEKLVGQLAYLPHQVSPNE